MNKVCSFLVTQGINHHLVYNTKCILLIVKETVYINLNLYVLLKIVNVQYEGSRNVGVGWGIFDDDTWSITALLELISFHKRVRIW